MREDLLPKTFDGKLSKIVEECGEVLQAIGKYQRHGAIATDSLTNITYDNIKNIKNELLDLSISIDNFNKENNHE